MNQKPSRLQIIVITIDVLVVFGLSILGNQVILTLPQPLLFLGIGILLILSVIINSISISPEVVKIFPSFDLQRFVPRTMAGMFPAGMLMGLIAGIWASSDSSSFSVTSGEWGLFFSLYGIILGLVVAVLLAIFISRHLAGALFLGYMLALPVTISIIRPIQNDFLPSLIASFCVACPITVGLILIPALPQIVKSVNEPRF